MQLRHLGKKEHNLTNACKRRIAFEDYIYKHPFMAGSHAYVDTVSTSMEDQIKCYIIYSIIAINTSYIYNYSTCKLHHALNSKMQHGHAHAKTSNDIVCCESI